jgi:hypothetical protein
MHAKNEVESFKVDCPFVSDLKVDFPFENKHKYVQFVFIFHLLSHGHPMTNYESYPISFQLLQVNSVSQKH